MSTPKPRHVTRQHGGPCFSTRKRIGAEPKIIEGQRKMQRSRMLSEFRNLVRATRLARANRMTLNEVLQQAAERQHRLQSPADVGS